MGGTFSCVFFAVFRRSLGSLFGAWFGVFFLKVCLLGEAEGKGGGGGGRRGEEGGLPKPSTLPQKCGSEYLIGFTLSFNSFFFAVPSPRPLVFLRWAVDDFNLEVDLEEGQGREGREEGGREEGRGERGEERGARGKGNGERGEGGRGSRHHSSPHLSPKTNHLHQNKPRKDHPNH